MYSVNKARLFRMHCSPLGHEEYCKHLTALTEICYAAAANFLASKPVKLNLYI